MPTKKRSAKKNIQKKARFSFVFYKELVMAILAILSVAFVVLEIFMPTSQQAHQTIIRFDIVVALIFLADFIYLFIRAKDKLHFLRYNWYLLLASIPIVDGWAEVLKGFRILELVRLVRAGSHLTYVYEESRHNTIS